MKAFSCDTSRVENKEEGEEGGKAVYVACYLVDMMKTNLKGNIPREGKGTEGPSRFLNGLVLSITRPISAEFTICEIACFV